MKVKELIEKLKEFPENATVMKEEIHPDFGPGLDYVKDIIISQELKIVIIK